MTNVELVQKVKKLLGVDENLDFLFALEGCDRTETRKEICPFPATPALHFAVHDLEG